MPPSAALAELGPRPRVELEVVGVGALGGRALRRPEVGQVLPNVQPRVGWGAHGMHFKIATDPARHWWWDSGRPLAGRWQAVL